jgi:hypothetical protein
MSIGWTPEVGFLLGTSFPTHNRLDQYLLGSEDLANVGVFRGGQSQGLNIKGLERFYAASQALSQQSHPSFAHSYQLRGAVLGQKRPLDCVY